MRKLHTKAYAKVNLSLDVVGKREDGYHLLKMVMQTISLHDVVSLYETNRGEIRVKTNLHYLPNNENNIAVKAANLFFREEGVPFTGLDIQLRKNIPVCAGLGGGSADAAGVLRGLYRLYGRTPDEERILTLGAELGADVPFALSRGTFLVEGIGERMKRVTDMPDCWFLVIKPRFSLSTKSVFSSLQLDKIVRHPDTDGLLSAIQAGDLKGVAGRMENTLEPYTLGRVEEISRIRARLMELGAEGAVMSGSGSAVFGVFSRLEKAKAARERFRNGYQGVYLCRPVRA